MIDLERLEQRLENSLSEDLRVYRSGEAPARRPERRPDPGPEARAERRAAVRPEPWREARPEPPGLDAGYVVIRPHPRSEPPPAREEPRLHLRPSRAERRRDVFAELDLDLAGHSREVAELLGRGDRHGADHHVAAHAALAEDRGGITDRRDAAVLATMVALLDGREPEARSGSDAVLALSRDAGDRDANDHHWAQRLWIVLEWGGEDEHGDLLDHCRQRAYRDGDTAWMGAISLLLARAGGVDEARAAFDAASRALDFEPGSDAWLDLTTHLAEAAALLADPARAATVTRALARTAVPEVIIGRGWVCKGASARYRGLLAAALGRWDEADREYRVATEVQRSLEAGPLLARTLHEWGRALQGRNDLRSRALLQEGAELGRRLALADFRRGEERAG